ncbi:uncharacterized protein [Dysidea avara]|uniref:uncharacterized protein isoform X2 n=1 Tax=Dysidea avara TaxID=196820 RepID=UPI003323A845
MAINTKQRRALIDGNGKKSKKGKDQTRNEDHKDAQSQPKFIVHLTTSPPRSPGPPLKDAINVNIGEFEANQVVIQDTSKEDNPSTCIRNDEED